MNKLKIILGYLFSFITSVTILLIVVLLILKSTVYQKAYIKSVFKENNYYENIANDINDNMRDYLTSSGFTDSILDNIYTLDMVENDINNFIDRVYAGKNIDFDNSIIIENITNNINNYLDEYNIKITSQSSLDSFILDIAKIYDNEVNLYHFADGLVSSFAKTSSIINYAIVGLIIGLMILFIILKFLNVNYYGAILGASGWILLFIKFVLYEKIDYKNITLISDYFGTILKKCFIHVGNYMLVFGIILVVFGLYIIYRESFIVNSKINRKNSQNKGKMLLKKNK